MGLVQLASDELMSDIDAAIDLRSGEAQKREHRFHFVDWSLGMDAWCHWTRRQTVIAVLTHICFYGGLRVGSNSEWFDWSQVVAWFLHGGRCKGNVEWSEASEQRQSSRR